MSLLTEIQASLTTALQAAGVPFEILLGPQVLQRENAQANKYYAVIAVANGVVSPLTRERFTANFTVSIYLFVKSRVDHADFVYICTAAVKQVCSDLLEAGKSVSNVQLAIDTELADAGDSGCLLTFETEVELE